MFKASHSRWLVVSAVALSFAMAVGSSHADQAAGRGAQGEGVSAHTRLDSIVIYGPYPSQRSADIRGQYEIDHNGADNFAAGYENEDPDDQDRGAGFYVHVSYP